MILLDLFSGYGGFHLGLERARFIFDKVYYSEINKHALANYEYNYPNAEHIGAVEHILDSRIERPNIITFGSPCQDFSLAGKRKGMDGERSSLIQYALAAVSHYRPDVFIWENVKGTFSSNNSEDFWAIIKAFADIWGYGLEWQLVNTKWLLPQNRERIYLVGHLAASCRDWREVFPIGEDDEAFSGEDRKQSSIQPPFCRTITSNFAKMGADNTYVKVIQKGHGFVKDSENDICPTIRSNSFEHNTAVISYTRDAKGKIRNYHTKDICNTLHSSSGSGGNTDQYITQNYKLRRLTEIDCERLQGLPDDWTKYGIYRGEKKEIAMKNRYDLIGNGVSIPVVEMIGKAILQNIYTE